MRPTLKTRKPIDTLDAADLAKFPIWEFASDEEDVPGRDETWVRPVDASFVRMGLWSLSVAADFHTALGVQVPGFVGISTGNGVELGQGVLLPKGQYLVVSFANKAARSSVARVLGLTVEQAFPLGFTLRVPIGREKQLRSGSLG